MKGRHRVIIAGILMALALAGAGIWFWKAKIQAFRSGIAVNVAVASQGHLTKDLEVPGKLVMEDVYFVNAKISAPVQQIYVREGQEVKAGQLLASLDVSDYQWEVNRYQAQLEQAMGELAVARLGARPQEIASLESSLRQTSAALEQARQDWQRLEELQKAGAIAPQQVEHARLEVIRLQEELSRVKLELDKAKQGARTEEIEILEAKVKEAKVALERAKQQVSYGQVCSPTDGYVLSKEIQQGQMVAAGMRMFAIGRRENLVVKAEVPERDLWAVWVGQEARISGGGLRGEELWGKVLRVAPVAEENLLKNEEARFMVTISIPIEEKRDLRPGMNVKVHFTVNLTGAILIPVDALVETEENAGAEMVWVVEEGRARRRKVSLGLKTDQVVEVVSGLRAGEEVILLPPQELADGCLVNIQKRT